MVDNRDIRAAIRKAIESIPQIGIVHDEKVVRSSQDEVAPFFQYQLTDPMYDAPSHLRGWQISLDEEEPGFEIDGTTSEFWWIWTWAAEGFLQHSPKVTDNGVRPESERTLHGLAQQVIEKTRQQSWYDNIEGGEVLTRTTEVPGSALKEFPTVMLGTNICHAAVVTFRTLVITPEV